MRVGSDAASFLYVRAAFKTTSNIFAPCIMHSAHRRWPKLCAFYAGIWEFRVHSGGKVNLKLQPRAPACTDANLSREMRKNTHSVLSSVSAPPSPAAWCALFYSQWKIHAAVWLPEFMEHTSGLDNVSVT